MRLLTHWLSFGLVFIAVYVGFFYTRGNFEEESVVDIVKKLGYPAETHGNITTEDGYQLTMFRIKHGRNRTYSKTGPVVLLMHGLLTSSYCFVSIQNTLAYVLADHGFDVWLPNGRGSIYSRDHVNESISQQQYWNFSWHEIGLYDVRAFIEHIIRKTGQDQIYFVGHSQGTTDFFVLASLYPEIGKRIKHMVAIAPILYIDSTNPMVNFGINFMDTLISLNNLAGLYAVAPKRDWIPFLSQFTCNTFLMTPFCWIFLFLNDYNFASFRKHTDGDFVSYMVAILQGSSMRQFYHYGQLVKSSAFQQYDHGEVDNFMKYDQPKPPLYDLSKVNASVSIYYSNSDHYRPIMQKVTESLRNITYSKETKFKHLDFLIGRERVSLYKDIIRHMLQH